jgi:c-di-GMP-binding flagellar brake protein YcgR
MRQTKTRKLRRDALSREIVPVTDLKGCERRTEFRHTAHQHVAVQFRNTTRICDLIDLSETGAKISILDGTVPNADENLILTLFDGTLVEGTVTWIGEQHIGIEFRTPVTNVDDRLDFEDLGSAYFGKAVTLQKSTRRS